MAAVQLKLPEDVQAMADARAAQLGRTVQEYLEALVRADSNQSGEDELEQLLLERLDQGGDDVPFTPDFARRFQREVEQRRSKSQ